MDASSQETGRGVVTGLLDTVDKPIGKAAAEKPSRGASARERAVRDWPAWALWALAAVPVLLALVEVFRAPRLNSVDYWVVLGLTADQSGNLQIPHLFHLYHEHPIVTVGLVFWLDAKLFAGSAVPLGALSLVLALAILAAFWTMLPAMLRGTKKIGVFAALSALVFSSGATAYFGDGMMGTQWLLGLAPAVVALAFAQRGLVIPAVLFAALGSLGHGVAFPVWIALAVVFWLRREPWVKTLTPLALGLVVFVLWRLAPWPPSYQKPNVVGLDTYLGAMTSTLGQAWSSKSADLAFLAGAVTIGLIGTFVVRAMRERMARTTPENHAGLEDGPSAIASVSGWFGLAVQVVLNGAMIGVSRGGYKADEGLSARYVGIALLAVAAVVVLLVTRGPWRVRSLTVPLALTMALTVFAVGNTAAGNTRYRYAYQPVLAVAMHTGAGAVVSKMYGYPDLIAQDRAMKLYPFTDDFTLGCGTGGPELGSTVDLSKTVELKGPGGPSKDTAGAVDTAPVVGDKQINGWALIGGEQAKCVLMADPASGKIVGGGTVGLPRDDINFFMNGTGRSGFQAVAAPEVKDAVVLVSHNGTLYRLTTIKDAGIK